MGNDIMKSDGFFAIDKRTWARVCVPGNGMMNEAVAYLVQAQGKTRPKHATYLPRYSHWSVNSVEQYTGISRGRAAAAIKGLQARHITKIVRGGARPIYDILPFSELPRADPRPPLSDAEKRSMEWLDRGFQLSKKDITNLRNAAKKGWLYESQEHRGAFSIVPVPPIEPDLIWLPNELVTGAVGEESPVERVRQTQDPMSLRLLVDMYYAQNLCEDGGVSRHCMWK